MAVTDTTEDTSIKTDEEKPVDSSSEDNDSSSEPDKTTKKDSEGSSDSSDSPSEKPNQSDNSRLKPQLLIEIGSVTLDSLNGDFLGSPILRMATYEHCTLNCNILDTTGEIFEQLSSETKAVVYVGFGDGELKKKFTGEKIKLGRIPPDATYLQLVDSSYKMSGSSGNSVISAGEVPDDSKATESDDGSDRKIIDTLTGKAGRFPESKDGEKMANGEEFSSTEAIASHRELSMGTECRVTNTANEKSVLVKIADKGPFVPGLLTQLSKLAADEIELPEDDFTEVKIEVLGDEQSEKSEEQEEIEQKDDDVSSAEILEEPEQSSPTTLGGLIDGFSSTLKKRDSEATKKPSIANLIASNTPGVKFVTSDEWKIDEAGTAQIGTTNMNKAILDAVKQGNVVVTKRDGAVVEVAPGDAPKSGVKIDYHKNRESFIGKPLCYRRSPIDLKSGYGAVTVSGFSASDGSVVSATVASSDSPAALKPGQKIDVPRWGEVELSEAIYPGCVYTWGDATRNGERVPESQEVMEGIVSIAQKFQEEIISKYENGNPVKWQINSWYRDPVSNAAAGGSSSSFHMSGAAIDFYPPGGNAQMNVIYDDLEPTWDGGLGDGRHIGFIHVDTGSNRRWGY
jgi:hypothetical protein